MIARHAKARLAAILTNLILLGGCIGDRVSGGSSETENAILARVFPVDSLLPAWNPLPGAATVAMVRIDSAHLDFQVPDSRGRGLDVRGMDGVRLPFAVTHWDAPRRQGRLQVRIDPGLQRPGASIALWQDPDHTDRSDPVGLWKGIADSLRVNLSSVLVDDFEGGSNGKRLVDSAAWYLAAGSGTVAADAGRPGKALRLVSAERGPVVLAAALLSATPRRLGAIDSIVLWARGAGRLRVALEHATPGAQIVAWAPQDLDTAWRRVRIDPAAFDASGGARWAEVLDSVTHLSFWFDGAGEAWIDEPRLFGIDRDDLR